MLADGSGGSNHSQLSLSANQCVRLLAHLSIALTGLNKSARVGGLLRVA